MKTILKQLFIFVLSTGSPVLWALSSSLADPDLVIQLEDLNRLQGSIHLRGVRNTRIPFERKHLWNSYHRDSVFSAMGVKGDLKLNYFLSKKYSLFASLDYERRAVAAPQELTNGCWGSYLCIGDMSLGVSGSSFFKKGSFSLEPSFYLNLPTSRHSWKIQTGGLGAFLSSSWKLVSLPNFKLSAVSSHFLDLYIPRETHYLGVQYNKWLVFFNQPGVSFRYSGPVPVPVFDEEDCSLIFCLKSVPWLLPVFYIYGRSVLTASSKSRRHSFHHAFYLRASAVWMIKNKFRLAAGLQWGDETFAPKGTPARVIKNRVFADRTYFTLGGSYAF